MRRGDQFRIGRTTWRTRSQSNTLGVRRRTDAEGGDAVWVLSVHPKDEEAATAEVWVAYRFNLPQAAFKPSASTYRLSNAEFWRRVGNNRPAALACLAAFGRDERFPFWMPGMGWNMLRGAQIVRACNLLSGMKVCEMDEITPDEKGTLLTNPASKGWSPAMVTRSPYRGPVYSLEVDRHH